jgi:hypothetical protein
VRSQLILKNKWQEATLKIREVIQMIRTKIRIKIKMERNLVKYSLDRKCLIYDFIVKDIIFRVPFFIN